MGTLVTIADSTDSKSQYTVATVAAGSVAPADGNLYLFVGASISSPLEAFNGAVSQCLQALREAHYPNPVTTQFSSAVFDTITGVLTVANGAAPTLAEDEVAILQGLDFAREGDSISRHIKRAAEAYLEEMKDA